MKSKFQRKNKNSFSKAKKKGKSTKVSGKFISLPNESSWKVWSKLESGMRIMESLMKAQKEDSEEKERDREYLF